jgi:hypothetical protein
VRKRAIGVDFVSADGGIIIEAEQKISVGGDGEDLSIGILRPATGSKKLPDSLITSAAIWVGTPVVSFTLQA